MTTDPQTDLRDAVRAVGEEFARALEQAERMARAACDDLMSLVADQRRSRPAPAPPAAAGDESPADAIRQLAALRAEGLITDQEFEAKKAELLERI
jgi:hypothetical protein